MTRALVLGGGGPVGFAWESGLVAGFAKAGVDLGEADYVLGTSAGAIAGARLASGMPTAALADGPLATEGQAVEPIRIGSLESFARMAALATGADAASRNPAEVRREIGAIALATETMAEPDFVEMIARELGELPAAAWPARTTYACTAVDAQDGGFQIWDAGSGVDLRTAVTSSCSVPGLFPPITLAKRRYIDGGMRSATNADLAAGHELVVVIALVPHAMPQVARVLAEEVESLQAGGSTVVTITPDDDAVAAFGHDLMDLARRADAARAGLAQAASQAAVLKELWG
jgi:NTE family protein